jgi:hypothetical protein
MNSEAVRPVRVRTASDRKKALAQYDELRRMGRLESAVVLCDMKDGTFQILGQGQSLSQIAQSLLIATASITRALDQQNAIRPEPYEEPVQRGVHNRSKPHPKSITTDADGNLVPPPGENFISCGECNHPRWYVLHTNATDEPARIACAHCGNEVINRKMTHQGGFA